MPGTKRWTVIVRCAPWDSTNRASVTPSVNHAGQINEPPPIEGAAHSQTAVSTHKRNVNISFGTNHEISVD